VLRYAPECECAALPAKAHLFSGPALAWRDWMGTVIELLKLER
jgi:hypothetical protein